MSDELSELKAELERLQAKVDSLQEPEAERVGRRNMLKTLGTAAAGATVGGLAFARPAAAVDGDNVILGGTSNDADTPTVINSNVGYTANPLVGVLHVTNDTSQTNANVAFSCVSAIATGTGGGAQTIAFAGSGSRYGAKLDGPVPLKLTDSTSAGAPGSSGYAGEFRVNNGDLWFCVDNELAGTNAVWKQIAGPNFDNTGPAGPAGPAGPPGPAGGGPAFTAVTPFRVYDSRLEMAPTEDGPIAAGGERVVPCRDAIDVTDGMVVTADAVPAGATAITFNLTVIGPTGTGFLTMSPSTATEITASTVNWGASTSGAVANGSVTALGGDREVKVFNGPNGTAHFAIDITGYYV